MDFAIVIAVVGVISVLWVDSYWRRQTSLVISHVTERLSQTLLQPIEKGVPRTEDDGRKVLTLSPETFRALLEYVRVATPLLSALGTDRWGNRFEERDIRYKTGIAAEREFFRWRDGTDIDVAMDSFAVWARTLHSGVLGGLSVDNIVEVQICSHRAIAFKTAQDLANATDSEPLCRWECVEPVDTVRVAP